MACDQALAARVRDILARHPSLRETKLMGGLSFMVNGLMCCSVSSDGGLLIRVGAAAMAAALAEPHVRPMAMAGRAMTGFVRIEPEGYNADAALQHWLRRALDFIATIPAKPALRRRP